MAKMKTTGYALKGLMWYFDENGKEHQNRVNKDFLGADLDEAASKLRSFLAQRFVESWQAVCLKIIPIHKVQDGTLNGKPVYTTVYDWVVSPTTVDDHKDRFISRLPYEATLMTNHFNPEARPYSETTLVIPDNWNDSKKIA